MKRFGIFIIVMALFLFLFHGLGFSDGKMYKENIKEIILDDLVGMTIDEVEEYASDVGIELEIKYEYSDIVDKDIVISQGIGSGNKVISGDVVEIIVSKGAVPMSLYQEYGVNELGSVPIMMYHGIVDMKNSETNYVGGNVDKDGYNRTVEAFRDDLEFYYQNGYRMIRLEDYVDGVIDVDMGMSPIVLTFDDGNENNFRVLGEKNGELVIDSNCAVGVLEEFKKKYPDYGVTATFFLNSDLFGQDKYNSRILKWLIDNGYDIGNHTMSHVDFTKIDENETSKQVGGMYQILNDIIPDKYVSIIALPFGSPYSYSHDNYETIISGEYDSFDYYTKAALRVGWEAEVSCFDEKFNPKFLKRIRAYDNNGEEFDIRMNFDILSSKRYISDGDSNTIVVKDYDKERVNQGEREVILY